MTEQKPYTVESQRIRRTVNLYGVTLAPKGYGNSSQRSLTKAELLGSACVKMLKNGRLLLVRGEAPPELVEALGGSSQEEAEVPKPEMKEEAEVVVDDSPSPNPLQDTGTVWLEGDLFALNSTDQKIILRSRGLKVGGKEAHRVERILAAQADEES